MVQLWHMGRQSHSSVAGVTPVGPSAIAAPGHVTNAQFKRVDAEVPHALTEDGIADVVQVRGWRACLVA